MSNKSLTSQHKIQSRFTKKILKEKTSWGCAAPSSAEFMLASSYLDRLCRDGELYIERRMLLHSSAWIPKWPILISSVPVGNFSFNWTEITPHLIALRLNAMPPLKPKWRSPQNELKKESILIRWLQFDEDVNNTLAKSNFDLSLAQLSPSQLDITSK